MVIDQEPSPEIERRKPTNGGFINIRLFVSAGIEAPVEMPDLTGLHWIEARNQLINLNLDLGVKMMPIEYDAKTENLVFETTPSHGEPISRGVTVLINYAVPAT